jgi:hypothetical protein
MSRPFARKKASGQPEKENKTSGKEGLGTIDKSLENMLYITPMMSTPTNT